MSQLGQKRRFWMSANRSALPPKTDVTLALSDLRQRRANLAVNLRKVVRRQMRQPYRAARKSASVSVKSQRLDTLAP